MSQANIPPRQSRSVLTIGALRVAPTDRGFATLTMVFAIAMVGMALLAIGALFSTEARRTRLGRDEAQLRQMLLAGGSVARQVASGSTTPPTAPVAVALPAPLSTQGATLLITSRPGADATQRIFDITATLGERQARQEIIFTNGAQGWQARSAVLTRAY